eukprot:Nk52_evm55s914 gene=Nk52_evmTU55s914
MFVGRLACCWAFLLTAINLLVSPAVASNLNQAKSYHGFKDPYRPIIGMVSQPNVHKEFKGAEVIAPFDYVDWIRSAGGRVVVIPFDAPKELIQKLFNEINGVLFIGGETSLIVPNNTLYYETCSYLYTLALDANREGDYFPVWGTCLGFEQMVLIQSQSVDALGDGYDSDFLYLPVHLEEGEAVRKSKLLNSFPKSTLDELQNYPVTFNAHHNGINPSLFTENPRVKQFFNMLGTSVDRNGRVFAAIMEGKDVPFYGTQFHPEIPPYLEGIEPPSRDFAVDLTFRTADFFVSECSQSTHREGEHAPHYLALNCQVVYIKDVPGLGKNVSAQVMVMKKWPHKSCLPHPLPYSPKEN